MKTFIKKNIYFLVLAGILSCKEKEVIPTPPTLDAIVVSEVTTASVRLNSAISNSGTQDISDYGFVYSQTNATPGMNDSKTTHGLVDPMKPTPLDFSDVIQGLKPSTSYYARAYSIIPTGEILGEVKSFKTSDIVQPKVKTDLSTNVSLTSATLQGTVEARGTYDITEYGICWSATNTNPTTADSKASKAGNITTFPSTFTVEATNLTINTTYSFRAYTVSNGVISYGNALTFKTLNIIQPTITTVGSNTITVNSAKLQGTVETKGTYDITEYGVCWSPTNPTPTTADSRSYKGGNITTFPSTFVVDAVSLSPNTTYNFRAYVISNGVVSYGSTQTFQTSNIVQPGITTDGSNTITINSARLQGTLTARGSYDISEHGICWSSRNTTPTTADSKVIRSGNVTSFPSQFTVDATNLIPATAYYYRAYVISNGVTTYGNVLNFRTLVVVLPTLSTDGSSRGVNNSQTLSGTILTKGSFDITEYGMCWSFSNSTPTVADTKGSKAGNPPSFPSRYTIDIPSLQGSRTYYFRAYVISNGVTTYGSVLNFSTGKD